MLLLLEVAVQGGDGGEHELDCLLWWVGDHQQYGQLEGQGESPGGGETQSVGQGAGWSQISETKTKKNDKISRLHNGWGQSGGV